MTAEFQLKPARGLEESAADQLARLDRRGLLRGETEVADLREADLAFADWIGEDIAHRVAFLRVLSAWQRTERLAALRSGQPVQGLSFIRRPVVQMMAAAACAAIALIGIGSIGLSSWGGQAAPEPLSYYTSLGEMQTVTLEDGSALTLNTDTYISVIFSPEERRVDLLRGEVFFDVAAEPNRPFLINAGQGQVKVLGTSFGVERLRSSVEVAVSEGTVWFGTANASDGSSSVLKPGMIGYASPDGLIVENSGTDSVASRLLWREGRLRFEDTPLSEVAAEFNRYNTTQLVITDKPTGAIRIGGTFPLDNVEAFARLVEDGLGLYVDYRGGQIEISSK